MIRFFLFILTFFAGIQLLSAPSSSAAMPPAPLPQTGQTSCWDSNGNVIDCAGTGQDGDKPRGVPWPIPRFVDNADGTVTDKLTNLIWLKNANCFGGQQWATAVASARALASGQCGLTDGSTAGQWHLPSRNELESLVNRQQASSADWLNSQGFTAVQAAVYWSGSTSAYGTGYAWNRGHVLWQRELLQ